MTSHQLCFHRRQLERHHCFLGRSQSYHCPLAEEYSSYTNLAASPPLNLTLTMTSSLGPMVSQLV